MQTAESGDFRPIGSNGFFPRGGARADFDQQPIEAHAMVSACLEAYRATSDAWWYEQAQRAFDWFLGWNDLGLELYSPNTGGCRDALHVDRVNQNQGAESTLAFLLSLAEMQLMQNAVTVLQSARLRNPRCHESRSPSSARSVILHPDRARVLLRPFLHLATDRRAARICARVLALPGERSPRASGSRCRPNSASAT